jgi:ABC-2 type transport system permease protein
MTSPTEIMSDATPASGASASDASRVRPFYWSVRRELWENRAIYMCPLIAAGVVLAGILIATVNPPHFEHKGSGMHLTVAELRTVPYAIAALLIMLCSVLVGVFYSLGALHNERRDRSILFWKSLPISDIVSVASKAVVPLVIVPLCVLATVILTHLVMLVLHLASLATHGEDPGVLLTQVPLLKLWLVIAWGLFAFSLWWAPIWGWLFLVSVWAKRMTFVWAVVPPIGLVVFERLAFGTSYVNDVISERLNGWGEAAFIAHTRHIPLSDAGLPGPDLIGFFASPGLWIGFVVAAALFYATVRLRRRADPI